MHTVTLTQGQVHILSLRLDRTSIGAAAPVRMTLTVTMVPGISQPMSKSIKFLLLTGAPSICTTTSPFMNFLLSAAGDPVRILSTTFGLTMRPIVVLVACEASKKCSVSTPKTSESTSNRMFAHSASQSATRASCALRSPEQHETFSHPLHLSYIDTVASGTCANQRQVFRPSIFRTVTWSITLVTDHDFRVMSHD